MTVLVRPKKVAHCRAFFSGFPKTTAPELISSSILGSRSDKLLRCDRSIGAPVVCTYFYGFHKFDILFIFALRIQSDHYLRFDFFDRYFLNVGGRSRDQKCAFLGESRATVSCS